METSVVSLSVRRPLVLELSHGTNIFLTELISQARVERETEEGMPQTLQYNFKCVEFPLAIKR